LQHGRFRLAIRHPFFEKNNHVLLRLSPRFGGSSGVPEYWGKDSPYHPGTDFLGTPKNHLDLVAKRPVSPHVFEIDGKQFHYKMPYGAISSITNRATGVMLSVGAGAAAYIALSGDLVAAINAFKSNYPLLVFPAKFAVSFPLVYHYLAGVRHLYWDHYHYGNMTDKASPLELEKVTSSSKALLYSGAALSAVLALYSL
jgi:succinate dehydrogenase (ubiquinone) cytochrome b560 subunit